MIKYFGVARKKYGIIKPQCLFCGSNEGEVLELYREVTICLEKIITHYFFHNECQESWLSGRCDGWDNIFIASKIRVYKKEFKNGTT